MLHFNNASSSLRLRLIFIPPIFLLLGIFVAIIATLMNAPSRVAGEIASGLTIGGHLIDYALEDIKFSADPNAALNRLKTQLSHVRHIRVEYKSPSGSAVTTRAALSSPNAAPGWLVRWLAPPPTTEVFPILFQGEPRGELVMSSEPADEVNEIWEELVFLIGLLSAISVGIVSLIWLSTSIALRPLRELISGLDRLERGEFGGLREIRVAELRNVGEQFNRLAKSLARTEADNQLLIDRLMSVQENERKELARELHDEFGASLFGIRAAASCIIDAASSRTTRSNEIIEQAEVISSLTDTIQKHNYRILERIQPIVLDQMGLCKALRHLVDEWCARYHDCNCTLELPVSDPLLSEKISIVIYRVVQECLTNVARHANAKNVHVVMSVDAKQMISICIADDGVGVPQDFRFGFGFLGMNERVRKLGGRLLVAGRREKGVLIEVSIPGTEARMTEESFVQQAVTIQEHRNAGVA
jgi:two-component system, NarL family, sensor histidine kinase UhpB